MKQYKNGGSISVHQDVDHYTHDFKAILQACRFFAKKEGAAMEILPRLHPKSGAYKAVYCDLLGTLYEGKSPDFRKVTAAGNVYYEHEGYQQESRPDRRLKHMLSRGLKQADRLVIDDEGSSTNYIRKVVGGRIAAGQIIKEIWIRDAAGKLTQVY